MCLLHTHIVKEYWQTGSGHAIGRKLCYMKQFLNKFLILFNDFINLKRPLHTFFYNKKVKENKENATPLSLCLNIVLPQILRLSDFSLIEAFC